MDCGRSVLVGIVLSVFLLSLSGCSRKYYEAKGHLESGYELFTQAGQQAVGGDSEKLYQEACGHYASAYDLRKDLFCLPEILEACAACQKAGNAEKAGLFKMFSEEYQKRYPYAARTREKMRMPRVRVPRTRRLF
ncbi:MAG TPA: hypothetical protein PLL75_02110 [Candidatus Omnitrophota bacterium]|nr:hypothetical protein [Candidatus Omnitrophota bacterium]HPS36505.1 hypothetical protein [Candidatus Omnitrophota bacterium]